MDDLKVRFYEITVKATDSAGNTGSDVCKVVIVPECSPIEEDCEELMMGVVGRKLKSGKSEKQSTDSNEGTRKSSKSSKTAKSSTKNDEGTGKSNRSSTNNDEGTGKSSKSSKSQKVFFHTQDNLNRAVTESNILYDLASVQLVWKADLDSPTV